MVCSCVVPFKRVLLQKIFCSRVIGTTPSREKCQIVSQSCQEVKFKKYENKLGDRLIKQLLNSVIAKISSFVSVSQIKYLTQTSASANNCCAWLDKSRYFAQPPPIIVNYSEGTLEILPMDHGMLKDYIQRDAWQSILEHFNFNF